MSKLLTTLLLISSLQAKESSDLLINYLNKGISHNPNVKNVAIKKIDEVPLKEVPGFSAVILQLQADIKSKDKSRHVSQKMVYFTNGTYMTENLINLKDGSSLKSAVSPKFKPEYYDKAHLLYGNANAAHKVVIFSDPLCPFCRKFVPSALTYMKQYPKTFALYYYHFPLPALHPASVALTKAAIVASHIQKRKGIELGMYKVTIDAREKDEQKILDAFNKALNTHVTVKDIHTKEVEAMFAHDQKVADDVMVQGTPTVFFDGVKDATKEKYKKVKVK